VTFSRFDDSLDGHPKLRKAGLAAVGLWTQAIVYSARHLTDGYIENTWLEEKVPQRRQREELVTRLVEARMFDANGGAGYVVHDYLDFNPSREEVMRRRELAAERKRKERMSRDDNGVTGA
jgi:hypothetical protein